MAADSDANDYSESAYVAEADDQTEIDDFADEAEPKDEVPGTTATAAAALRWPGWPGFNVFRLIVPVIKVGAIIGRKGELIKKVCDETGARVRILDAPVGTPDRVVLISAKEELEAAISPAMDAAFRIFKRANNIPETDMSGNTSAVPTLSSVKLLVASSQATNLIGKRGSSVKTIQENSGAVVKIYSDELAKYATSDERIVEIQGESLKVLKALEAVLGHLRKFLVDQSVMPFFEKSASMPATQDHATETWTEKKQSLHTAPQSVIYNDHPLSLNRGSLLHDHGSQLESQIPHTRLSLYGQDPTLPSLRASGLGRTNSALVAQITQTMQIPLAFAEEIIGIGGGNIAYIRRVSGAVITLEESRTSRDEIIVEIKGSSSQVQAAEQLIQEFVTGRKEPGVSSYTNLDSGYRSNYSSLADTGYLSSLPSQSLSGYGSSGLGGYGRYRL